MKKNEESYVYEEITLQELGERFASLTSFDEPSVTDLEGEGIQVLTVDSAGNEVYKDILSFVVKPSVEYHYTDGKMNVTKNHTFVESGVEIKAQDHVDFVRVNKPLKVVDIEVGDLHTYLANGRLNHNTTSGGKALGFHASCRIRLKGVGKLKSGSGKTEQVIGVQTEAQVIKNRMGPPFKKATFDIYFNSGINDYGSWLALMKDYGALKQSGAYYTLVNEETGEEIRFMSKDWRKMLEDDADLKQYCYNKICDIYIMKYKDDKPIDPDDISVGEGDLEE